MTRFPLVGSAVLAAVCFAVPSFAQMKDAGPAAAMAAPTPSKELETWMKPLEGNWKCDTKMMAGSMGPDSPEMMGKSTVKISKDKDSGGIWYRGDYSMPKSKTMPPMKGTFLIGHDEASKQVKSVGWDSMGNASVGTGTMTADTITYSGETTMMGQKMKFRDTMTKTGPKGVTHKFEADHGKGWQVMGEDTCTK